MMTSQYSRSLRPWTSVAGVQHTTTLECIIWRWPSHTVTVIHHNYFMLARSVNCWLMQRLKTARLCPLLYNLINVLMLFVSLDSALWRIKVNRWGLGNDEIVDFTFVSWCFNALIYGYVVNRFKPLNTQIRVNWYFGDYPIRWLLLQKLEQRRCHHSVWNSETDQKPYQSYFLFSTRPLSSLMSSAWVATKRSRFN